MGLLRHYRCDRHLQFTDSLAQECVVWSTWRWPTFCLSYCSTSSLCTAPDTSPRQISIPLHIIQSFGICNPHRVSDVCSLLLKPRQLFCIWLRLWGWPHRLSSSHCGTPFNILLVGP